MMTAEHEALDIKRASDVELGSFTPASETAARNSLVIASYNIRYAVGSFLITGSLFRRAGLTLPRRRARLVERHIERAARAFSSGKLMPPADIIALQEADKETARAGGRHVARLLARELQMHYAHAPFHKPLEGEPEQKQWYLDFEERIEPTDTGVTGIALLSRMSPARVERLELPWTAYESRPHIALQAPFALGAQEVQVFNLHIDPHATTHEQLEQHRAVLSRASQTSGPTVILGDFNTLSRAACHEVRSFMEEQGYATPMPTGTPTWRSGLIRLHPDWIFVRGLRVLRWGVLRPLGTSDHWPVWAEIELEGEAER